MEAYQRATVTDQDPTLRNHIILAAFSSIACRVFAVRREGEHESQVIINFIPSYTIKFNCDNSPTPENGSVAISKTSRLLSMPDSSKEVSRIRLRKTRWIQWCISPLYSKPNNGVFWKTGRVFSLRLMFVRFPPALTAMWLGILGSFTIFSGKGSDFRSDRRYFGGSPSRAVIFLAQLREVGREGLPSQRCVGPMPRYQRSSRESAPQKSSIQHWKLYCMCASISIICRLRSSRGGFAPYVPSSSPKTLPQTELRQSGMSNKQWALWKTPVQMIPKT